MPLVRCPVADITQDINSELDELDREEFYRLKKVSNKKQRDTAAQDAEILAKRQGEADKENKMADVVELTDVLGEEDEDVIF
jgi:V-type H+-transporting ATPase subunit D